MLAYNRNGLLRRHEEPFGVECLACGTVDPDSAICQFLVATLTLDMAGGLERERRRMQKGQEK